MESCHGERSRTSSASSLGVVLRPKPATSSSSSSWAGASPGRRDSAGSTSSLLGRVRELRRSMRAEEEDMVTITPREPRAVEARVVSYDLGETFTDRRAVFSLGPRCRFKDPPWPYTHLGV